MSPSREIADADVVVKFGGSLLFAPIELTRALVALERGVQGAAGRLRVVVVPGGGPFADAVRSLEASVSPGDDAAHWMAILGMSQFGHLLASRLTRGVLVEDLAGIRAALAGGAVPVLAPYAWLRANDPLPHRWVVTSDSIAAWIAGQLRAPDLLLLKSRPGTVEQLADAYLPSLLHESATRGRVVRASIVVPGSLESALSARRAASPPDASLAARG